MSSFKVIIVGGGLSGALLANGLLNNNIDFMVYERDSTNVNREGYQIRLGDGAQAGFRACLTAQQHEAIMKKLGKSTVAAVTGLSLYTTQFRELIDLTSVPNYSKSAGINRVVLRDLLLSSIKDSNRIKYGKAFVNYKTVSSNGADKILVSFADGSSDSCDLLIGADGAHSRINKQIGLNNIVRIDSHWSFVSKSSLPYSRMMELPAKLRQSPILVASKHTTMYCALYLPEGMSKGNPPRHTEQLQYDEEAASIYWGLNIPVNDLPFKDASDVQDRRQVVLDHVKDWAPEFRHMISVGKDDPDAEDIAMIKLHASSRPAAHWREHKQTSDDPEQGNIRVWLMGDAMHAMQPHRGQGGNQSLYDCADMLPHIIRLDLLAKSPAGCTLADIHAACDAYEGAMIPRAFEWVKKSGGTSMPNIDFDGWVGVIIRIVAIFVTPVMRLYFSTFGKSST